MTDRNPATLLLRPARAAARRRLLVRSAAWVATTSLAVTCTLPMAHAQPSPLQVHTSGCQELDAAELTRLTQLELAGMAPEKHRKSGTRCDAASIAIDLRETRRDIVVTREMPRDCCKVSAERTLALLAAGLYTVAEPLLRPQPQPQRNGRDAPAPPSSAEAATPTVNTPPPPPTPLPDLPSDPWTLPPPLPASPSPASLSPASPSRPPVQWLATPALSVVEPADTRPPRASTAHDLGAAAQVRIYNVGAGITSYGVRLHYLYWVNPELGLGPIAEADFGSLERMGGSVDMRVFHFGGAVSWRLLRSRLVDAALMPFATLSVVQLEGNSSDDNWQAGTLTGVTGATGVRLASWLGPGPLRLMAAAEGGALFRAPRGEVSEQDSIQVDGLWLGFGLGVDVGWGGSDPPATQRAAMKGTL